jgi:LysR family transcriptional regulator, mexEF-oprN operon transcriptional activator
MPKINDAWGRDLDLNLLRVFAVVAEEGSLTRAAARLYVTQPAVSASMRRLTTVVGAALVTRQGHGVVLTTRGTELLAVARAHLQPLIAATMAGPLFDPRLSTATLRLGLADGLESAILPKLLARLRDEAPAMRLVVLSVQFRTVEEMLLANKIDFAVTVADELPRSILRQPLGVHDGAAGGFLCLYDARFAKLTLPLTEHEYFAQDHVVVSYAGDTRGIVEDALGRSRTVRVSVPAFSYVADVVEGSPLVATVPSLFARHVVQARPRLRTAPLPFALEGSPVDLLWSRVTDDDAAARFFRGLVSSIMGAPEGKVRGGSRAAKPRSA